MGRKLSSKKRKELSPKMLKWLQELLPKIQEMDLKAMNMDELAQLGGKSKSTLYEYFKSKEEILMMAIQGLVLELGQYPLSRENEPPKIVEDYEKMIEWIASGVKNISFTLITQIKQDFPEIWQQIESFLNNLLNDLRGIYERGIKAKVFREVPVSLLLSLDRYFVMEWITQQTHNVEAEQSLEKLIRDYVSIRLQGILD